MTSTRRKAPALSTRRAASKRPAAKTAAARAQRRADTRATVQGPITVDRNTWLYVEDRGLLVVHEARNADGVYILCDQFYIPWRTIERAQSLRAPKVAT